MSGYLTSLVRRAMAPELSVRPRLPSMFGPPPMPGPRLDSAMPVVEDEGVEETITPRRGKADARTLRAAAPASPAAAPEPPMPEATAPARPSAPPRPERHAIRSARPDAAAETDRPSPQQADAPRDEPSAPPEERRAVELRQPIRDVAERDAAEQEQQVPALPRLLGARTPDERSSEPSNARVARPIVSPDRIEVKDAAKDDRGHPVPSAPADRPRLPQRADRVDPALRVTRTEIMPRPAEQAPHSVGRDRDDQVTADARETAPAREPGRAPGEPLPVRSRLSLPPRRDDRAAERPTAPDPIIQVTIGRVEVRASTSPEPRQKPRPANGAGSLDDYLRQRSGRSRP